MSNYGYGGGQNPFDEREAGYGGYNQGGYNQGGYNQGGYGQQSYDQGSSMEMSGGGSIAFLNECRNIDNEIKRVENNLGMLRDMGLKVAQEADQTRTNQEIIQLLRDTTDRYTDLNQRVRTLGSNPESKSPKCKPQFDRLKRTLKTSMGSFATVRAGLDDSKVRQAKRDHQYIHGSDDVDGEKFQSSGENVFSQAVMQTTRTGQASKSLQALRARAEALESIEKQMSELGVLFEQMDSLVVEQDVVVAQIEQKAEETVENLDKGNEEIGVAVETARKTRKKKWICLGIVVVIIAIIAIVLAIHFTSNNGNSKRSLGDQLQGASERLVPRVVGQSNIKKWIETRRRGMVPTGMPAGDGELSGDAFDLVKRVPETGHDLTRAFA